ncbi:MAG: hypothetical protein ACI9YH_000280 [Colwellia sp.]
MTHFKFASSIGVFGVIVGLCAFLFNYHIISLSFPGYRLFVAPAIFLLSFFSEETDFIPKMILFISGQFLGYFTLAYFFRVISGVAKKSI